MPKKKTSKNTKPKRKLPAQTIKYLEKAGIKHDILEHKTIYTAIDAANTMKKKVDEIAKSILVKADKNYYMVILPADHNLDMSKLKKVISKQQAKNIQVVKIPKEKITRDFLKLKKDSIAAFGSMYKLPVVLEKKMVKVKKAVFSSDSFNHSVEMAVKDFVNLEKAVVDTFGIKKKIKKAPTKKSISKKSIKKRPTKKASSNIKKKLARKK